MSTVVYLSNQKIQVITGATGDKKIKINSCYTDTAPEGSLINGMIMDVGLFIGFMKDFWKNHRLPSKDVILVVNSTKFVGKNIELPILNDKKSLEFIEREFTDINKAEEHVYGYIPIGSDGKMRKIYAESITPDFIREYVDIFGEIGVKLSAIYSGESSLIGLTAMTVGRQYRTFVMQLADGMMITTLLWVDGSFYYFNSSRCFHDQGTEDYANDIARSVSQITQFMQAHQIEFPLEAVVMAGITPSNLPMYAGAIEQVGVQAPVRLFEDSRILSSDGQVQNFLHGASGLVSNGKSQNFLLQYQLGSRRNKDQNGINKDLILVGAILAVMLLILAVTVGIKHAKTRELQKLKEYNEDPITQMDIAKYDILMERTAFLSAQYNAIGVIDRNLYTYPVGNEKVIGIIESCAEGYAEVTMDAFDAKAGQLSMSAKAEAVEDINKFITRLNEQEIFNSVVYTGYTYEEQSAKWDIHVICTLAESAGRKTEEVSAK